MPKCSFEVLLIEEQNTVNKGTKRSHDELDLNGLDDLIQSSPKHLMITSMLMLMHYCTTLMIYNYSAAKITQKIVVCQGTRVSFYTHIIKCIYIVSIAGELRCDYIDFVLPQDNSCEFL